LRLFFTRATNRTVVGTLKFILGIGFIVGILSTSARADRQIVAAEFIPRLLKLSMLDPKSRVDERAPLIIDLGQQLNGAEELIFSDTITPDSVAKSLQSVQSRKNLAACAFANGALRILLKTHRPEDLSDLPPKMISRMWELATLDAATVVESDRAFVPLVKQTAFTTLADLHVASLDRILELLAAPTPISLRRVSQALEAYRWEPALITTSPQARSIANGIGQALRGTPSPELDAGRLEMLQALKPWVTLPGGGLLPDWVVGADGLLVSLIEYWFEGENEAILILVDELLHGRWINLNYSLESQSSLYPNFIAYVKTRLNDRNENRQAAFISHLHALTAGKRRPPVWMFNWNELLIELIRRSGPTSTNIIRVTSRRLLINMAQKLKRQLPISEEVQREVVGALASENDLKFRLALIKLAGSSRSETLDPAFEAMLLHTLIDAPEVEDVLASKTLNSVSAILAALAAISTPTGDIRLGVFECVTRSVVRLRANNVDLSELREPLFAFYDVSRGERIYQTTRRLALAVDGRHPEVNAIEYFKNFPTKCANTTTRAAKPTDNE
jgi:hypothetical protein